MRRIEKKILTSSFEALVSGKKNFELRLNEFDVEEGDVLVLREILSEDRSYTGREIVKEVIYVDRFKVDSLYWPIEDIMEQGLQVISLK